jgi:hypothetical protein
MSHPAREVVSIAAHREIRSGGPGSDDEAGDVDAGRADGRHGELGVVERSESRLGDDEDRRTESACHVEDRELGGESHQYTAGALDEGEPMVADDVGDPGHHVVDVELR